jgi:hypothetical protein
MGPLPLMATARSRNLSLQRPRQPIVPDLVAKTFPSNSSDRWQCNNARRLPAGSKSRRGAGSTPIARKPLGAGGSGFDSHVSTALLSATRQNIAFLKLCCAQR